MEGYGLEITGGSPWRWRRGVQPRVPGHETDQAWAHSLSGVTGFVNEFNGDLNGSGKRFAIVVTRFNSLITEQLVTGATDCLLRHGVEDGDIDLFGFREPGSCLRLCPGSPEWQEV